MRAGTDGAIKAPFHGVVMLVPLAALALLAFLLRPLVGPGLRRGVLGKASVDKLVSVAMVVAALAVLVHGNAWAAFCLFGLSLWTLGRATGGQARPQAHRQAHGQAYAVRRSALVELATDRASGRRFAKIVAGPHRGADLGALGLEGCLSILAACRRADADGAVLLESYLDGRFAGWRAARDHDADAGPPRTRASGGMTEEQAYQLLGLGRGASRDAIVRAHRTLMKRWHPDGGGTAELAARANEAKEVLLRRHG